MLPALHDQQQVCSDALPRHFHSRAAAQELPACMHAGSLSLSKPLPLSPSLPLSHTHTLVLCGLGPRETSCALLQVNAVGVEQPRPGVDHVSISGIFVLIREKQVNGIVVSPPLSVGLTPITQAHVRAACRPGRPSVAALRRPAHQAMRWSSRALLGRNRAAAIGCCCLCARLQVSSDSLEPALSGVLTLSTQRALPWPRLHWHVRL